jgi:diadenosine tetraphosphatase ApaH/serine/threonine PP2A family protein phosphatase
MYSESLKTPKYPVIKQIPDVYDNIVLLGDIHGCLDQLMNLYKYFPSGRNAIVPLGDLVDRGPFSGEVVRYLAKDRNTYVVMGNHDNGHVRYENHKLNGTACRMNKKESFLKTHEELLPEDIAFLASCPQGFTWKSHVFVHAGVVPDYGVNMQTKGFVCTRFVELKNGRYEMSGTWQDENKVWQHKPEAKRWSEVYTGEIKGLSPEKPWKIVYGHANLDDILIENGTYGIDTGCVFGRSLTAMVINCRTEQITFKQVKGLNARRYLDE